MTDHEDEPAPGLEDTADGCHRGVEICDVHQSELAGHAIEGSWLKLGELLGVVDDVGHVMVGSRTMTPSDIDHRSRGVCAYDPSGTCRGNGSGRKPLAAPHVEYSGRPIQFREQSEEAVNGGLVGPAPGLDEFVVPDGDVRPRRAAVSSAHAANSCTRID